jgi:hypothetical protein
MSIDAIYKCPKKTGEIQMLKVASRRLISAKGSPNFKLCHQAFQSRAVEWWHAFMPR